MFISNNAYHDYNACSGLNGFNGYIVYNDCSFLTSGYFLLGRPTACRNFGYNIVIQCYTCMTFELSIVMTGGSPCDWLYAL